MKQYASIDIPLLYMAEYQYNLQHLQMVSV